MNLPDIFRLLQVVLGIGLVIFVHEAGHFLAARWCGVRVDVFSLGFGPRLFGWRRGPTLYQVALIPIGGYVKMAGEMSDGSGRPPRPDDLVAKGVWQRFFIYSGGVLMNVLFALIVFPLVLSAGVPVNEPIVTVDKGSPAWHARLLPGTRILEVDGQEVYDFFHIPNAVALAGDGPVEFVVLPPGETQPSRFWIEGVYNEDGGFRQIGVRPAPDPELALTVDEDGPAWRAGMRTGDRLLGITGEPQELAPLDQIARAIDRGEGFQARVARGEEELLLDILPEIKETERLYLGVGPLQNVVKDWRPGDPWLERLGLVKGERLVEIDGRPVVQPSDLLAALLDSGLAENGGLPEDRSLPEDRGLELTFAGAGGAARVVRLDERPDAEEAATLAASLFLDFDDESTLVYVQPDRAAASAGLRTGDRLVSVAGVNVETWKAILAETRRVAPREEPVAVGYERRDEQGRWVPAETVVVPAPLLQTYIGFAPNLAQGIYRTDSVGGSIRAGMTASWRFLTDAWLTLKKMLTRQVSAENLGGIITIGRVSHSFAAEGWAKLFFFLCLLSINLAFLNVLPIPVLDGGHLFFCIVEAVKGSPVSERTLGYSQIVGLVLILTLMVYVTYQDVLRILPQP